ncbi:MAG: hypothetical protein H6865_08715 [Rhodospirillales bacterium]|nr:hypothetical protein [Alphaproteobacteria bacterium]MCB9987698.1 hypothetical protein [Rhodospirillales bacterium]USO08005.1 MAG: hypothetical protein H6866_01950 [Rhodospirillales bacterium]
MAAKSPIISVSVVWDVVNGRMVPQSANVRGIGALCGRDEAELRRRIARHQRVSVACVRLHGCGPAVRRPV